MQTHPVRALISLPLSSSSRTTSVCTCAKSSTRPRALQAVFERKLSRPNPVCVCAYMFLALRTAAPCSPRPARLTAAASELTISSTSMESRVCERESKSCAGTSPKRVLPVKGEQTVAISSYSNMLSSWSSSNDLMEEMAVPAAKEARGPAASFLLVRPLRMLERSLHPED